MEDCRQSTGLGPGGFGRVPWLYHFLCGLEAHRADCPAAHTIKAAAAPCGMPRRGDTRPRGNCREQWLCGGVPVPPRARSSRHRWKGSEGHGSGPVHPSHSGMLPEAPAHFQDKWRGAEHLREAVILLSPAPGAKRSGDWHEGQSRTPQPTGYTRHPHSPTSAWGLLRTPGWKVLPASFSREDTEAKVEMCLSGPGIRQAELGPGTGLSTPGPGVALSRRPLHQFSPRACCDPV